MIVIWFRHDKSNGCAGSRTRDSRKLCNNTKLSTHLNHGNRELKRTYAQGRNKGERRQDERVERKAGRSRRGGNTRRTGKKATPQCLFSPKQLVCGRLARTIPGLRIPLRGIEGMVLQVANHVSVLPLNYANMRHCFSQLFSVLNFMDRKLFNSTLAVLHTHVASW